jgi:hypothetical protein
MKLQDKPTTIERIGNVSDEAQFRMKTSRKSFQVLSDLYSDKPLAIVRELGCNAADSMVASGKGDQPFHVHLPNTLEPWLIIQDFGTGISHNDIYEIYAVYFSSTKTNTNDQVGCLGLGSKSPFCYTDNFSVTSIVDGEKRIYNAYFNEDATPAIALMSTENTNEKNGVAIQIPVKTEDFGNFSQAVWKAFRFFDVKPTISGGKIEWDDVKPSFKSDDWAFYDKFSDRYNGSAYAIMGGVTYPIDMWKIDDSDNDYRQMLKNGLVMKFEMGELDFTPSREQLSYCEMTIKALNKKIAKVAKELPDKVTENINEKETLLDALRAVIFFTEKFYFLNINRGIGRGKKDFKIAWKGIDITDPTGFLKKLAPGLKHYYKRQWHRQKITVSNSPNYSDKIEWYVEDLGRGAERRIKTYVKDSSKEVMVFTQDDYDKLLKGGFSKDYFKSVASLPTPTTQRKVRANGTIVQKAKEDITIYTLGEYHKEKWDSEVIEPSDTLPKYYIIKPTDSWTPKVKLNGCKSLNNKSDLSKIVRYFGLDVDDVCMVSEREEKKVISRGGCVKLEDWWKQNVQVNLDLSELKTVNESHAYYLSDLVKKKSFKDMSDNNPVKAAILKLHDLKKKHSKSEDIAHYLDGYDKAKEVEFNLNPAQKIVFDYMKQNHYDTDKFVVVANALG